MKVAGRYSVWVTSERVFSTCLFPALKHSLLAQNAFITCAKVFVFSTIEAIAFNLEGGLKTPKKNKVGEEVFVKVILVKDGLRKGTETRRK